MSELPPSYWDDINRYCGEILSRRPSATIGIPLFRLQIQQANWPSATEPDRLAALEKSCRLRFFGLLKGPFDHCVRITDFDPLPERQNYTVAFDPKAEKITCAYRSEPFISPTNASYDGLLEYIKEKKNDLELAEAMGLHLPHPEDADILHAELQRGADEAWRNA